MRRVLYLLTLLIIFNCSKDDDNEIAPVESGITITYKIEGSGTMEYVHYYSASTSTSTNLESDENITLPYEVTIQNYSGNKVGLRAIIDYTSNDITSFEIYKNGMLLSSDSEPSSGEINHWTYDIESTF